MSSQMAEKCDEVNPSDYYDELPKLDDHESLRNNASACDSADPWPSLPWNVPTPWEVLDGRGNAYPADEKEEAWRTMAQTVKTYSDEMIARWTNEMDTLLVYAGLFSAILTAFNVQSYQYLTPSPPDPVLIALQQISAQLSSFSVNPSFVNSTQPAYKLSESATDSPPSPTWAVWLNTLWFSSLIFSLSAASIAMMVKQWLNEYSSGLYGIARHPARLRQHRLNGLIRWRVGSIVAILPVLLQIALFLFLAGLLVLLWTLNPIVSMVASILIALLFLFTIATVVLPSAAIGTDCCYLSPLSIGVFYVSRPLRLSLNLARRWLHKRVTLMWHRIPEHARYRQALASWLVDLLYPSHNDPFPTLRSRELSVTARYKFGLDADTFATAYTATMDLSYLSYAELCFSDLTTPAVRACFNKIKAANARHQHKYGQVVHQWADQGIPLDMCADVLLANLDNAATQAALHARTVTDPQWEKELERYLRLASHCTSASRSEQLLLALSSAFCEKDYRLEPSSCLYTLCLHKIRAQLRYMRDLGVVLTIGTRRAVAATAEAVLRTQLGKQDGASLQRYVICAHILLLSVPDSPSDDASKFRAVASHALNDLSRLMRLQLFKDWYNEDHLYASELGGLICTLHEVGPVAGLTTDDLVEAMAYFFEGITTTYPTDCIPWIKQMKRDLDKSRRVSQSELSVRHRPLERPEVPDTNPTGPAGTPTLPPFEETANFGP